MDYVVQGQIKKGTPDPREPIRHLYLFMGPATTTDGLESWAIGVGYDEIEMRREWVASRNNSIEDIEAEKYPVSIYPEAVSLEFRLLHFKTDLTPTNMLIQSKERPRVVGSYKHGLAYQCMLMRFEESDKEEDDDTPP
ncbi:MAG: hypothetical protein M1834_007012 [Cirrosporium novae-zelandiae]|nr:MAG: hypothetical protein M1834_007012 [Cirrosporium novae-zelandiae]